MTSLGGPAYAQPQPLFDRRSAEGTIVIGSISLVADCAGAGPSGGSQHHGAEAQQQADDPFRS